MPLLKRRLRGYWNRFRVNNRFVGRLVELTGNKVHIHGVTLSLDTPLVSTPHKSTIYFGLHEPGEAALAESTMPSHLPVVEFGGGLGMVSCMVNQRLEQPRQHIVVEANPHMVPVLEGNRDLNSCHFQVKHAALGYGGGTVSLSIDREFVGSHVGDESAHETVPVPAVQLATLIDELGAGKVALVCDIEGAEVPLVENEFDLFAKHVDYVLMEVHPKKVGEDAVAGLLASLRKAGLSEIGHNRDTYAFERKGKQ